MNKIMTWLLLLPYFCLVTAEPPAEDQPLDWNDPKWAWMDEQIAHDFYPFEHDGELDYLPFEAGYGKHGITEHMLDSVMNSTSIISFGDALTRLQVINREVYGPDVEAKRLLQKVAKIYPVPNVDVIIHGQDIIFNHWQLRGPVLVTCKTGGVMQILFPSQLWETWVHFAKEVETASQKTRWEDKIPKYFWRGKPNDADNYNDRDMWTKWRRGKFCNLSKQFPDLIDAAFSHYHCHSLSSLLVEEFFTFFPKKEATWEEYIGHKYLPELDGYVAGTPSYVWKLLSNCAVFKQESPYLIWCTNALRPWTHYIPFKEDLSDILERLQWAKDHDAEAKQIAENGRQFAKENLMPEHLYLFCYKVLAKYASLQRFPTKMR